MKRKLTPAQRAKIARNKDHKGGRVALAIMEESIPLKRLANQVEDEIHWAGVQLAFDFKTNARFK